MIVSLKIRLPLLALLAASAFSTRLDEDLKSLEDLEDILLGDEKIRDYSDKGKGRTPDALLNQFNNARRSPMNKRKLVAYLKMLEAEDSPFSRMLSPEDVERRRLQIKDIIGKRENCETTTPEYRTIDGTCNNPLDSEQGAAETMLIRMEDNAYDDGVSEPRTASQAGGPLPSARDVSRTVFDNVRIVNDDFTTLTIHFGQLTDHDLTAVQSQRGVDCPDCSAEGECFAIPIDASDPVFGAKQSCFHFTRSNFETDSSGVRQQVNSITTYLDASFVYGSDEASAAELVDENGSLEHLIDNVTKLELLPPDLKLTGCAGQNETEGIFCGLAGDGRAAEQPGLTSLHTLFLREHNRIADQLRNLDPSLSADEVYHRTRKIVGAEWQHIVYREYLPLITGAELYTSAGLSPDTPYAYDPNVDASIANVFAAAAFRFGHTQVPFTINRVDKNYHPTIPEIVLSEAFFNATYMFDTSIAHGAVDSILRGMAIQSSHVVDRHFSDAITDNLFGDPDVDGDGFDLPSLNIQRARDHGIPSYPRIRSACGLGEITRFRDLVDDGIMSRPNVQNLREIYDDVADIDAFVGLVLEEHLPNALVGPTLACIFADQFHRLKFGDRFFYQNSDQFSQAQIDEIEKVSMARLMCDNVKAVKKIQPYLFVQQKDFRRLKDRGRLEHERLYDSFYEYSRSGAWPHKRPAVLDGFDNRKVNCRVTTGKIPEVDISKFV